MKKEELIVVIDPGHGKLTPGKCSPDKSYYEYEGNRIQARFLEKALDEVGIKHKRTVNDDEDLGLSKRSKIANGIIGINKGCLISLHSNASGNGNWSNARGWEIWTTKGQTNSDKLADCIFNEVKKYGFTTREDKRDGDVDFENDFTVIYMAKCPAVLIEGFYHDNKEDLKLIESEEIRKKLAEAYVRGIMKYYSIE